MTAISTDDYVAIANLMGRYQHLVDEGDEERWPELFTEDGEFHGLPAELTPPGGFVGREGLKGVPRLAAAYAGKYRHHVGSLWVEYGANTDEAFAHYYAQTAIMLPDQPPAPHVFTVVHTHLLRIGGEWKIKSNTSNPL